MIKGAWGADPYSFEGTHYTITDYNGIPKPTQQPRPPILVGGGGPRVLRLAGREADIVGINPNLRAGAVTNDAAADSVAEMIDQKVEWIREGAGLTLRRPGAADPLLLRRDHRRPQGPRRSRGTRVRARGRGRARVRDRVRRDDRRDLRPAPRPPRPMGCELHRHRRRPLRSVRAGRGAARRDVSHSMHDPGLQSLRRAARVAIVVPVVFAIFLNGRRQLGRRAVRGLRIVRVARLRRLRWPTAPQRGGAYLTLTVVGAALVVVGTLVCNEPVLAALIGVVVATAVRFAGCFGGYFAASVSPLILAYVLGASVPAPMDAIPDRLLGWVVAGLARHGGGASCSGRRRERMLIREAAAAAADALADAIDDAQRGRPGRHPRCLPRRTRPLRSSSPPPRCPGGRPVRARTMPRWRSWSTSSNASACWCGPRSRVDAAACRRRDARHRRRPRLARDRSRCWRPRACRPISTSWWRRCLDDETAVVITNAVDELERGAAPGAVLDEIDALVTERLALLLCASALANTAVIVSGHGPSDDDSHDPAGDAGDGGRDMGPAARARGKANAVPASAWAQESLRAGIAVGAALLIAGELRLDHGFWVVLGTLSVLRSNAFATGRTALMAALGTAIGFAVSAGAARGRRVRPHRASGSSSRSGSSCPRTRRRSSASSSGRCASRSRSSRCST